MSEKNYSDVFAGIIRSNDLSELPEALRSLHDDEGIFRADEGHLHDYKQEYPFSSSDNFFAGILRLICALHNSYGGFILFGVHDKTRRAGHNKVRVDSEKINRKLREVLSQPLEVQLYDYESPTGAVQVLIVPVRGAMSPPIYSTKRLGDQVPGKIFLRKGAEVLEARGSDLPFLYSDRVGTLLAAETTDASVPASLPPSPATIQEFVGRFRVIESVIDWMTSSRDPRLFLWGQGGSGKSTIAYEAAVLIADGGKNLKNKYGMVLDRVLFISGKATYLDPHSGRVKEVYEPDFKDGLDIFRAILHLAGWADLDKINGYNRDQAIDALEELFEIETLLIVIDDIDTLTTSNVDAGMEELFLVLSRSRSGTKLLYTLRGFPSYAPNAAVEVPGLRKEEFDQFVELCCDKFSVESADSAERNWIEEQSEGRPLAIETIIGMRRITSSYSEAFKRWKENSSEAREYLFKREYQQLSRDDRGRNLLAALSVFDAPQSFDALLSVLGFSTEQLQDAIAETRDIFLRVSNGKASGDVYSIGAATRLFILEVSKQLDMYSTIEAKVNHFKSKLGRSPAAFVPILDRASKALRTDNALDAVQLLTKEDFPAAFKEHPEVKALLGQAYAKLKPPRVVEARQCFEAAFALGHRNYKMYLEWLELEKTNRTEVLNGIEICRKVTEGEDFEQRTKATFYGRLARLQALRSKDVQMTAPDEALTLRIESVLSNLRAFTVLFELDESATLSLRERANDSINIVLRSSLRDDDFDTFFDTLEAILNESMCLNEFAASIAGRIVEIKTRRPSNWKPVRARLNRLAGRLREVKEQKLSKENVVSINSSLNEVIASCGS